jgi:hypothetical protein
MVGVVVRDEKRRRNIQESVQRFARRAYETCGGVILPGINLDILHKSSAFSLLPITQSRDTRVRYAQCELRQRMYWRVVGPAKSFVQQSNGISLSVSWNRIFLSSLSVAPVTLCARCLRFGMDAE